VKVAKYSRFFRGAKGDDPANVGLSATETNKSFSGSVFVGPVCVEEG
jgi:hypothetical protein